MRRELRDFETVMMVGCTISEHFEQIRETCNSLMIKLHKLKIVNVCMLSHTGIKLYEKLYRKVHGAIAKFFRCNTPAYAYPLFKTHKLSVDELLYAEVADIPVRLLQSAGNIPTSRITAFFEVLLKPISVQYCSGSPNEFCKDSRHYIEDLISWQKTNKESFEKGTTKSTSYITVADVKALYPSLQRHLVNEAIEDALKKHSCYNRIVRQIIAELNNICLENVIIQYGSCLYKQRGGIVAGDNHSVSLANITVHYILQPIADILDSTMRLFGPQIQNRQILVSDQLLIQYLRIMA